MSQRDLVLSESFARLLRIRPDAPRIMIMLVWFVYLAERS